jgi:hypothetical protein
MPEVLCEFQAPVTASDGTVFRARAWGDKMRDGTGRWHGWVEFVPSNDGPAIQTPRETTQPDKTDTAYWASGLTPHYLEGALRRAVTLTFIANRRSLRQRRDQRHAHRACHTDVERASGSTAPYFDMIDRVLDKGIVIEARTRMSLYGIDLIALDARVAIVSFDTHLRHWLTFRGLPKWRGGLPSIGRSRALGAAGAAGTGEHVAQFLRARAPASTKG